MLLVALMLIVCKGEVSLNAKTAAGVRTEKALIRMKLKSATTSVLRFSACFMGVCKPLWHKSGIIPRILSPIDGFSLY